jgi:hypothetical protein
MSWTFRTGRVSDLAPGRPTRDEVFPARRTIRRHRTVHNDGYANLVDLVGQLS